jgi:putative transposase
MVKGLIGEIDKFDIVAAREGREAALRKFRSSKKFHISGGVLETVQIDHTIMDLLVIHDESLLPLGRPTLTACIDVRTRCCLGIYIGFEPPSFVSVAQCLKHAMCPKTNLRELYPSINGEWIPFGVPEILVVDNGLEFHAGNLEAVCKPFGIDLQYAPRKAPWFKPHIERFFGTLSRATVHKIPGTTFANIFEKADYDAAKNAVMTLATLRELIHKWIVDIYHQTPHRGLGGRTPASVWHQESGPLPPMPTDPRELDGLLGGIAKRTVSHKGVEFDGIQYWSAELEDLRRKFGASFKTKIRFNPADLGEIFVQEPKTNAIIRTPAKDLHYAKGLSQWQHSVIKRYSIKTRNRSDIEALAQAKRELRELVERDIFNKRLKTRATAARYEEHDKGNYTDAVDSKATTTQERDPRNSPQAKINSQRSLIPTTHTDDDLPDFEFDRED